MKSCGKTDSNLRLGEVEKEVKQKINGQKNLKTQKKKNQAKNVFVYINYIYIIIHNYI